ncbi:MAG TPA: type I methionyl aminopeptidase [Tenuifilaceae bacterium]|jgi:methionyl aminopeptidase|nr:type I methionyl aminopeptidase [Bacteroidales bacterium]MDI9515500.1 type I methionyl aminopeptidase [Bacteroidota bacterium]OQC63629.1 MAG: Methionine aminopeptidase 1 [Bacteroidetes bacterium ADurb.Bin008]HNV81143.1 type I methionyl aminopeptidase [Tenuifilaceae bacterium]MZP82785.1 type I methionyl aminopeptidase [Bacteroidales bacterium]
MQLVKTVEEIELLRQNGDIVSRTLAEVGRHIRPGVSTIHLDRIAETFIRDHGAEPGFLGYNGYPNTLCVSVNDAVVHGIPSKRELRNGDIVSIDCGTKMHGYYGDSAYTFTVGEVSKEVQKLLNITKECLSLGILEAVDGARVGNISQSVQDHAERSGFSVVRELVGHGLGSKMHEKPEVPNYGKRGSGPRLYEGMVICIEPMINMGKRQVYQCEDGWTIRTFDGKPSAHFELTVVVRKDKPELLSTFKYVEEVLQKKNN